MAQTRANCRSLAMTFGNASTMYATSSAVFPLPKEKRTAARANSCDNPIAWSTCDGSSEPTAQADPLETATPSRSSPSNKPSSSQPSKLKLIVLAERCFA